MGRVRRELERAAEVPIGRALLDEALREAWVESTLEDVARRLGAELSSGRRGETRRALEWQGRPRTLSHLVPDFSLLAPEHHVFVDAKYKPTSATSAASAETEYHPA